MIFLIFLIPFFLRVPHRRRAGGLLRGGVSIVVGITYRCSRAPVCVCQVKRPTVYIVSDRVGGYIPMPIYTQ